MVEPSQTRISVQRQCQLLDLPRSSYYYEAAPESAENLELMRRIDELYTEAPFFGSRRMVQSLRGLGYEVNRKRVQRLMELMGLEAQYPKPNLSRRNPDHVVYPYLLRGVLIERVNQVWSTDITYIRLRGGFLYLTAVIDWYSRFVLSWDLSSSMEGSFCRDALRRALRRATPEIFNTDQGPQFTSERFLGILKKRGIAISMDGKGRCLDNVFVERLWRSVKHEEVYRKDYTDAAESRAGLGRYFDFYNHRRPHQSLEYRTPAEVYGVQRKQKEEEASFEWGLCPQTPGI